MYMQLQSRGMRFDAFSMLRKGGLTSAGETLFGWQDLAFFGIES